MEDALGAGDAGQRRPLSLTDCKHCGGIAVPMPISILACSRTIACSAASAVKR